MQDFVLVDQVERTFALGGGKEYIALKGIDLQIKKGGIYLLDWSLRLW